MRWARWLLWWYCYSSIRYHPSFPLSHGAVRLGAAPGLVCKKLWWWGGERREEAWLRDCDVTSFKTSVPKAENQCFSWKENRTLALPEKPHLLQPSAFSLSLCSKLAARAFQPALANTIWSIKINLACFPKLFFFHVGGGGGRWGKRKLPAALTFEFRLATAGL